MDPTVYMSRTGYTCQWMHTPIKCCNNSQPQCLTIFPTQKTSTPTLYQALLTCPFQVGHLIRRI